MLCLSDVHHIFAVLSKLNRVWKSELYRQTLAELAALAW